MGLVPASLAESKTCSPQGRLPMLTFSYDSDLTLTSQFWLCCPFFFLKRPCLTIPPALPFGAAGSALTPCQLSRSPHTFPYLWSRWLPLRPALYHSLHSLPVLSSEPLPHPELAPRSAPSSPSAPPGVLNRTHSNPPPLSMMLSPPRSSGNVEGLAVSSLGEEGVRDWKGSDKMQFWIHLYKDHCYIPLVDFNVILGLG